MRNFLPRFIIFLAVHIFISIGHDVKCVSIRGGLVPQAGETDREYYDQFELDYGSKDNVRIAGSMRGFIKNGRLEGLPEQDLFMKWWNRYLEVGPQPPTGRIKPFYVSLKNIELHAGY